MRPPASLGPSTGRAFCRDGTNGAGPTGPLRGLQAPPTGSSADRNGTHLSTLRINFCHWKPGVVRDAEDTSERTSAKAQGNGLKPRPHPGDPVPETECRSHVWGRETSNRRNDVPVPLRVAPNKGVLNPFASLRRTRRDGQDNRDGSAIPRAVSQPSSRRRSRQYGEPVVCHRFAGGPASQPGRWTRFSAFRSRAPARVFLPRAQLPSARCAVHLDRELLDAVDARTGVGFVVGFDRGESVVP